MCHLIDINNLPSLKTIAPDGQMIKKEQIMELKSLFSKDSIYTNESIYIIKEAEKLNKEAANTMLKFLEEPEGNVIGFFITNSKDNMMLTIKSRCQLIDAYFNNSDFEELNIDNETYENYINILNEYLYKVEIERKESIIYNKEYLSNLEKSEIIKLLDIMLKIYKEKMELSILNKHNDKFSFLNNFSYQNLSSKVNLLIDTLNRITYNVNVELLMDDFVLEMELLNETL